MKFNIAAFLFLFFSLQVSGQENRKLYRVKVIMNSDVSRTGIVVNLADSAVQIIKAAEAKSGGKEKLTAEWIPVGSIRELRFRKLNALKNGILGGAAIGLVIGGIIGNVAYQPCDNTPGLLGSECDWEIIDRGASTFFGALMGVHLGAGIGALMGAQNKKVLINGDQSRYTNLRTSLEEYVMR